MVVHDITDRRKREESLAKSEKRFKDLIELAPDGIVTLNLKGVITYCNAATVQLTGYPKDEIVGKHISNLGFVRARDIPRFLKLFTTIVKGKIPDVIEIVWNHKDGTPHSAEIRVQFLKEDSKPTELLVVTRDTTKAKKAEENLRESEQRYRSIVELAPDGIVTADLKGFITSCNTAFFQLSGFSEDEIIGKHFTQLPTLRAKDMPAYMKLFASLISGKRTKPVEFVWVHKDGTLRLGEVKASVLKKGRRVTGLQTVLRDITERRQAEEALKESEEKYRTLFEGSRDAIIISSRDGTFMDVNQSALNLFGYTRNEIANLHIQDLFTDPSEWHNLQKEVDLTGYVRDYEVKMRTRNGSIMDCLFTSSVWRSNDEILGYHDIIRDITERTKMEKALRESEELFRNIFENTVIGLYRTTPSGQILMANPTLVHMLGYTSFEELAQRNLEDEGFELEYSRQKFKERMEQDGEIIGLESHWVKRDGTSLFVRENARAVRDDRGHIVYYEGTVEDVTDRKKAEEKLKASLQEKEVLLREIHHRVKNNLQVILSLLNLQATYVKDNLYKEMLKESRNRIRSMALIHERLYHSENVASINSREYIRKLVYEVAQSYGMCDDKISFILDVEDISLGIDAAIPCGLIINELVSNSLKHAFGDGNGEITVGLHSVNGSIELTVKDNGVGLPDNINIKDCESLGLRLVTILAEDQLEGTIELVKREGTEFRITFEE